MYEEGQQSVMRHPAFKWGAIASIMLLAAFLAVQVIAGIKEIRFIGGGVPVTNTVTVQGEGEVFAVPDIATFTFSVVEERQTVDAAQEEATKKTNDLIAFLKGEGVEEKDIKTLGYNVYPRYEFEAQRAGVTTAIFPPPPRGERVLVGFEVRQTIEVKVRDTARSGELLSGIGTKGVSEISGLQFTIDDEEALLTEARKKAIEDAQAKARQLAGDLDVRLVRVVSFNENGFGEPPFPRFFDGAVALDSAESKSVPEIPLGENKLVSRVSITYEIR